MAMGSRWDTFRDLLSLQEEMNQFFGRATNPERGGESQSSYRSWAPALDISERKDAYLVNVELPGVKPDELDITLEDGVLTISGERRFKAETNEEQYHRVERRYGAFRRSITLPTQVQADKVEATFEDGVLLVSVPKAEEAKPKKIQISAGGGTARKQVDSTSSTTTSSSSESNGELAQSGASTKS